MSDSQREQRENEHVEIAMSQKDALVSDFDKVRFVHHSIPSIDVSQSRYDKSYYEIRFGISNLYKCNDWWK